MTDKLQSARQAVDALRDMGASKLLWGPIDTLLRMLEPEYIERLERIQALEHEISFFRQTRDIYLELESAQKLKELKENEG